MEFIFPGSKESFENCRNVIQNLKLEIEKQEKRKANNAKRIISKDRLYLIKDILFGYVPRWHGRRV